MLQVVLGATAEVVRALSRSNPVGPMLSGRGPQACLQEPGDSGGEGLFLSRGIADLLIHGVGQTHGSAHQRTHLGV